MAGLLAVLGSAWFVLRRSPRTDAEARARIAARKPAPTLVNAIVFTLDTLRADRLGCYGFAGIETPHIDGLAREGVLFEQTTATAPLTFPSHATIFTGLIPPHHGVRDDGGFFLDHAKTTLAETLKTAGFATGAFVGSWVLSSRWGLDQGFDRYADRFDLSKRKTLTAEMIEKPGDEVMDQALAWLATVADRRFFAWIHLNDPHAPYDPPEPYRTRYRGHPYLGEIAYTDSVVGRLLTWLKDRRLTDRTLVVLMGDHGESLGEHGEATHGFFLYDATLSVPLVIRTPWGDRGRVRGQVSLADVFPTVIDLLGLPPPVEIDGQSLVRAVLALRSDPDHRAYAESLFPRYHFSWQQLRAVRQGRFKLVDAPQAELYDLSADPGENNNVLTVNSRRGAQLRVELEAMSQTATPPAPERKHMDPETVQRLAELGFVGNAPESDPRTVLPDPKDKIDVFFRLNAARAAANNGRLDDAIGIIREVLRKEPRIVDVHLTLGDWLRRAGHDREAIAAYQRALALNPQSEQALTHLVGLFRTMGRDQDAIEVYQSALRIEPRNPQTWYHLATLHLDLERADDAEKAFREALGSHPKLGAAYNSLGAIAWSRGDLKGAEALIRQGLELEPDVRTGRFNLGRILEARGRLADAEALYREELASYPDHGEARFNLAQLLRQRGDRDGYLKELALATLKAPECSAPFFSLAREELKEGRLDQAEDLARRGLAAASAARDASLGHYVLAEVLGRQGRPALAKEETAKAHRLEASLRRAPSPTSLNR